MTESVSRIQILDPERLLAIIENETKEGRRDEFARGLLRLLETQASFIANGCADRTDVHRVATLLPDGPGLNELTWCIRENPRPSGLFGKGVINGALIRHSDNTWGSHT